MTQAAGRASKSDAPAIDFPALSRRIESGDADAESDFCTGLMPGIRFNFARNLGDVPEVQDFVQETLLLITANIRQGRVRDHDRIIGYVHTIVRRQIAMAIEDRVRQRARWAEMATETQPVGRENPEQDVLQSERRAVLAVALSKLNAQRRELLTRYYLHEQKQEEICRAMKLTETQFRLQKSRAKAELGKIGQRLIRQNGGLKIHAQNDRLRALINRASAGIGDGVFSSWFSFRPEVRRDKGGSADGGRAGHLP